MKNKIVAIISSIAILIGLFVVGAKMYKSSEADRLSSLSSDDLKLFMPEYSPVYGDENAKVILTEFLDPECESCRIYFPKVKKLLEMYKGKVKLVVRYAAFHRNSKHAIKVLEATRKQNKYWESLALLFNYQPGWADHHNPQPQMAFEYLKELDIDIAKLKEDMKDPKIEQIIEMDAKAIKTLKLRGTPSFFVNGVAPENFGEQYLYNAVNKAVQQSYKTP